MYKRQVERITKRLSHHIICVSKQHQEIGIKNRWINPKKTSIIYNGISPPLNKKMKLRNELEIDKAVSYTHLDVYKRQD